MTPLFLLLVPQSSKEQSDPGLCNCGWWIKGSFLAKQLGGEVGDKASHSTECIT